MTLLGPAASDEPARWLVEAIDTFAEDVTSLVPAGFESYARIFYPASDRDGDPIGWQEIASATGRMFHPAAQWPHLAYRTSLSLAQHDAPEPGAPWAQRPNEGCLPLPIVERLMVLLSQHTSTPSACCYAAWEGWGALRPDARSAPLFRLPSRAYHLYQGPIHAMTETLAEPNWMYQSASLWWPEDRAWCVTAEIDFDSAYVGASASCVEAVVSDPFLEALRVDPGQGITWDSDTLNRDRSGTGSP